MDSMKDFDGRDFDRLGMEAKSNEQQPLLLTKSPTVSNPLNVIQLGISFCILFTAFNTTQSFEASINKKIGLESLSILYGCFAVSNIPAGAIVSFLTERYALLFGGFTYVAFIAAHLHPTRWTLLPTAALLGFGAAILWTAQGSYLAKNSDERTRGRHSGYFFACFMLNAVIGNLGAAIAFEHHMKTRILFYILFGTAQVGAISFLFLRAPTKPAMSPEESAVAKKGVSVIEVLSMLLEPSMLLLIPTLIYWGFSQSFFFGPITQLMSKEKLGFVMTTFGAADTIGSIIMGQLSDMIGRGPVLGLATASGLAGYILIWVYSHHAEIPLWTFFVVMGLLGFSDSGFNTQVYATMSALQPHKAESGGAFLKLFQSSCTAIAFLYSQFFGFHIIIYIVTSSLVAGFISFVALEYYISRRSRPNFSVIQ